MKAKLRKTVDFQDSFQLEGAQELFKKYVTSLCSQHFCRLGIFKPTLKDL